MQPKRRTSQLPKGVQALHSRKCLSRTGSDCTCEPSFRAFVYVPGHGKTWQTFATPKAAEAWREETRTKQRKGHSVRPSRVRLGSAFDEWCEGAEAGTILDRGGRAYKPSTVRSYRTTFDGYVRDDLGSAYLSDIRHTDLVRFVERLQQRKPRPSSSSIRNAINTVRVVYRRALSLGEVGANPTTGLVLPNGVGHRERAASAPEAAELLNALPSDLRPIYATAFYAGLRRGELRGLRWEDVDLAAGTIHVRRGYDDKAGEIAPKSEKGTRTVPLVALLRDHLAEHKTRTGGAATHFVFPGRRNSDPFTPTAIRRKATRAWATENERRTAEAEEGGETPKLVAPIGLHECRHTFVSLMHDAGLPLERIGDYVGHGSSYMTDRYRHLLEGHEAEAARMFDAYLARADSAARIAQLDEPEPDAI